MAITNAHLAAITSSISQFSCTKRSTFSSPLLFHFHSNNQKIRKTVQAAATSIPFSYVNPPPPPPPPPLELLEREFSSDGVSFESLGNDYVIRLVLNDGTTISLMMPSGLITSYRPRMWHGGCQELLHTIVSKGREEEAIVQGGVFVGLKCMNDEGKMWSPRDWTLKDIRGNSRESIQVELGCRSTEDHMADARYIITLEKDLLGSEVVVSSSKESSILQLMSSIMSHISVSTPEAVHAVGLGRSTYRNKPPLVSDFTIVPPDTQTTAAKQYTGNGTLQEEDIEQEEDDNMMLLTQKTSRIYTYAPRSFTILDRGKRNSVIVGREGFEEFHVFSPGSEHEWYGRYAYVCAGPSTTLRPVTLGPHDVWRGVQFLHNPNS